RVVAAVLEEPHVVAQRAKAERKRDRLPEERGDRKRRDVAGHDDVQVISRRTRDQPSPISARKRDATPRASKNSSAIARAALQWRSYSAFIASIAASACSTVVNANRPSPRGRMLPKPVSCATTGLPLAR